MACGDGELALVGRLVDLSGTQLKRFAVNLSKRVLNKDEFKLLAKETNFPVTPDKTPVEEIITATETVSLTKSDSDQLRTEVVGLSNSPNPTSLKRRNVLW